MTALVPVPPTVPQPTPPLQMIGSTFLHFPSVGLGGGQLEVLANPNGKDALNCLGGPSRWSSMIFPRLEHDPVSKRAIGYVHLQVTG